MVQLKYFGDSRDYFKYDLITHVLKTDLVSNYAFVPMLTSHRDDAEGNKRPNHVDGKSKDLMSFIENCESKDLEHWESWLIPHIDNYLTVNPVNEVFFDAENRNKYWVMFKEILQTKSTLVFVDPDTGLETGTPSYLKKMGAEKYILNGEFRFLCNALDDSSVLMVYQHLPNNKHQHEVAVSKKINQAIKASGCPFVMAYREDDLAFLFVVKNESAYLSLCETINLYFVNSGHKYKTIHYAPNKRMQMDRQKATPFVGH